MSQRFNPVFGVTRLVAPRTPAWSAGLAAVADEVRAKMAET